MNKGPQDGFPSCIIFKMPSILLKIDDISALLRRAASTAAATTWAAYIPETKLDGSCLEVVRTGIKSFTIV
jgi:hypothetical protein